MLGFGGKLVQDGLALVVVGLLVGHDVRHQYSPMGTDLAVGDCASLQQLHQIVAFEVQKQSMASMMTGYVDEKENVFCTECWTKAKAPGGAARMLDTDPTNPGDQSPFSTSGPCTCRTDFREP